MTKEKRHYLQDLLDYLNISGASFAKSLGYDSPNKIYYILRFRNSMSIGVANDIMRVYSSVNRGWLLTGEGEMLKDNALTDKPSKSKLIPFYDDVVSIGGKNEIQANTDGSSSPSEYIDAGDWFRDATAAIRHYGESMTEYPTGCILALKEVQDRNLIVPGRDYCIETSEYRVTKRVQKGNTNKHITAYSTNLETYPDGRQIHEPFDIPLNSISKIFLVLGYVVKKNGGTIVFNANNK